MRRFFAVVAAAVLGACVSSSGLAGGEAQSDAGTTDSDAGAGPNLLANGDFELGCAGWDVSFGFTSEASEAHGGKGSCKLCMDTNWETILEQTVKMKIEEGKTYFAEAWLKPAKPVSDLEAAGYVESSLRISLSGAETNPTTSPPLTGEWLRSTAIVKASRVESELEVKVRLKQTGNPAAQGNIICVYVDDVVLRRLD